MAISKNTRTGLLAALFFGAMTPAHAERFEMLCSFEKIYSPETYDADTEKQTVTRRSGGYSYAASISPNSVSWSTSVYSMRVNRITGELYVNYLNGSPGLKGKCRDLTAIARAERQRVEWERAEKERIERERVEKERLALEPPKPKGAWVSGTYKTNCKDLARLNRDSYVKGNLVNSKGKPDCSGKYVNLYNSSATYAAEYRLGKTEVPMDPHESKTIRLPSPGVAHNPRDTVVNLSLTIKYFVER